MLDLTSHKLSVHSKFLLCKCNCIIANAWRHQQALTEALRVPVVLLIAVGKFFNSLRVHSTTIGKYGIFLCLKEVSARPDGGYLFIGDDTLFSHCQISAFNVSKVMTTD